MKFENLYIWFEHEWIRMNICCKNWMWDDDDEIMYYFIENLYKIFLKQVNSKTSQMVI